MIVVSDTSPIRALAHLNCLHFLGTLFDKVLVPPLVVAELETPSSQFKSVIISSMPFVEVASPTDATRIMSMSNRIHLPEAQALALALERAVKVVIMDDAAGRAVANRLGLQTTGALGLLGTMREQGLVEPLRPMFERLRDELRFHMTEDLIASVLRKVGEA